MNQPLVKICSKAVQHLKKIALQSKHSSVFIGVQGGGCNGLKYQIEPTSTIPEKRDEKVNIDGLDVIICGKSLMYLIGTEITWEKNFMGEGFKFTNPNASGSCGCGETFSI